MKQSVKSSAVVSRVFRTFDLGSMLEGRFEEWYNRLKSGYHESWSYEIRRNELHLEGSMSSDIVIFPLLSGYKPNRFSWLTGHGNSSWESIC